MILKILPALKLYPAVFLNSLCNACLFEVACYQLYELYYGYACKHTRGEREMIYGITLIVLSILAVPSLILAKKPDAKALLDKVAPYQGWIGLVFCFWGVWGIISAVLNIRLLGSFPIWWITWIAGSAVEAVLGFMLGYGTIAKLVLSKNEEAKKKGEQLLAALAPKQGILGLIGIGVGLWTIVAYILFNG